MRLTLTAFYNFIIALLRNPVLFKPRDVQRSGKRPGQHYLKPMR